MVHPDLVIPVGLVIGTLNTLLYLDVSLLHSSFLSSARNAPRDREETALVETGAGEVVMEVTISKAYPSAMKGSRCTDPEARTFNSIR